MRTGTHYFPRGVNGVAAVERSRQKFGLNKIDETVAEGTTTTALANHTNSHHRRTESCDLGRRLPKRATNSIGITSDNGVIAKDAQGYAMRGLSPDLHRHLAYQNYKGMECKFMSKDVHIFVEMGFSLLFIFFLYVCM